MESPQWPSTVGRGACEQGSCPGFQASLQVPRTPCPRGPGCPGCLWASSRDGWMGLQDVPLQGARSAVCRRWGPGRTLLCGCPFSAREGAEGERESGVGCRLGANVRGGLREGLNPSAAWLSLPDGQRGSSCVCPAVGPRWPVLLQATGPYCQPWEMLQGPWALVVALKAVRKSRGHGCVNHPGGPPGARACTKVSCGHVCTCRCRTGTWALASLP